MLFKSDPYCRVLTCALLGVLTMSAAACSTQQIVQGECRPVNGADICVWGEMSGNTLVAFGTTVPIRSVENAPADAPMVWPPVPAAVIPLPEAVKSAAGFDNLTMYWEPHGHPPEVYLTPHFDFHFNTISIASLEAIDCVDSTKPSRSPVGYELPDATIPQIGTLIGLCVPKMGMHAVPGAELHAEPPFEKTVLVGYYHGQPTFLEPMISRAVLLQRRSFALSVPAIPEQPAKVRYPTRVRADYDSEAQAYRFVFSDFKAGTVDLVSDAQVADHGE